MEDIEKGLFMKTAVWQLKGLKLVIHFAREMYCHSLCKRDVLPRELVCYHGSNLLGVRMQSAEAK